MEITNEHMPYKKRQIPSYKQDEKVRIGLEKKIFDSQLKLLQFKKVCKDYKNQKEAAENIVNNLMIWEVINIMLTALTQSGKTGCMCETINQYLSNPNIYIPIENIYIITGLSSTEWKTQTKERLPDIIGKRVYHRGDLLKLFNNEIKYKDNVLIIIDELQIAAKDDKNNKQTISKSLIAANLYDIQFLYKKDIKIVQFTATPGGTIKELDNWGNASRRLSMQPGEGYVGAIDLMENGRVYQFKDLYGYNKNTDIINEDVLSNIREIRELIEEKYKKPRYHIIRTQASPKQDKTVLNFRNIFDGLGYDFKFHDGDSEHTDINTILKEEPEKHTFIFIKESSRCAKTLYHKHLGILYERWTKTPDDDVIIQGLLGRNTGYTINNDSVVFTNISTIENYKKLRDNGFELNHEIKWTSKTIKNSTFNNPKNYNLNTDEETGLECEDDFNIQHFEERSDAIEEFHNLCKFLGIKNKRGPNTPSRDKEGFYVIKYKRGGTTEKLSKDKLDEMIKCGELKGILNQHKTPWVRPVYLDPNNKNSLKWYVITFKI